jgi:hypothetical protein
MELVGEAWNSQKMEFNSMSRVHGLACIAYMQLSFDIATPVLSKEQPSHKVGNMRKYVQLVCRTEVIYHYRAWVRYTIAIIHG